MFSDFAAKIGYNDESEKVNNYYLYPMNFLSHFYFDRKNSSSYEVTGAILPDLIKNANKEWNFYPQKQEALFLTDPVQHELLNGWKKHLEVDKRFHSSLFFEEHTTALKALLKPILQDSAVRPSFLAHIGVELLLDHLLIENRKIDLQDFYTRLENCDEAALSRFLTCCGLSDSQPFLDFFQRFKSARYLFSYQKTENISYALQRICMRIWPDPFTATTAKALTGKLDRYKEILNEDYLRIFDEIDEQLVG
ncbi:hypothetical protein D9M68_477690 [compost metagenome]